MDDALVQIDRAKLSQSEAVASEPDQFVLFLPREFELDGPLVICEDSGRISLRLRGTRGAICHVQVKRPGGEAELYRIEANVETGLVRAVRS